MARAGEKRDMKRLILIRHAKSAWDSPNLADFDRPLAPRGRAEARWIGETLRQEGWMPDLVLCSPAVRTRETLSLAALSAPAQFEQEIYDLMAADFVGVVRAKGGRADTLLLVGHNNAMETTALTLCGGRMDFGGYPTGAIAVLDFDVGDWSGIAERTGRLVAFCRPPRQ